VRPDVESRATVREPRQRNPMARGGHQRQPALARATRQASDSSESFLRDWRLTDAIGFSHLPAFMEWLMLSIVLMIEDTLAFLALILAHNPMLIVLLVGSPVLFTLIVIDTHRHRKKEHRRRDMGKDHPF